MNRKLIPLIFALAAALLLSGSALGQDDMATYLARAQEYYAEGVDEFALLQNPFVNPISDIKPGMLAPNFTLLDMAGTPFTLNDARGEKFIIVITGSWY